jgi:hypothetical protein
MLTRNPSDPATDKATVGPMLTKAIAPLLGVASAVLTFADGVPSVPTLAAILAAMQVIYLVFGVVRRRLGDPRVLTLQLAGLLVFGGIALAAVLVTPDVARYLLAAGWLGHGVWDLHHHRADLVVPGAYAHWCGAVDICGGAAILALW